MSLTTLFVLLLVIFCFPVAALVVVLWRMAARAWRDYLTRSAIECDWRAMKEVRGRRVQ